MSTTAYHPVILTDLNLPWERALHLGVPVSFSSKQIIHIHGPMPVQGFYYIRKGRVRLSYIASNGQEKVLFYVGRGVLFNEIPAMTTSTPCIFTCMEATSAVFFKLSTVRNTQFIANNPELLLNWIESTSTKSNHFFNQLCNIGLLDAFANVCHVLYSMVLHNTHNGKVVPQLSQQELASLLGIHRGSLHKALTRLKNETIIGDYHRKELPVFDAEKLRIYAES